ncbi:hypothetical protein JOQ06_020173 [Pogonophryne albipinna]|uniref:RNA methyltransferase n=1 Tax=Pogonophryne albipinna TaxID=1090488 RepID=A0AAD6BT75_9TELE|nr:hypothetical protein JOQ06_020173 [Pogonophryne albipinna]
MIRMSLDTETVLPHEVSPAAVSLSEQSQLAKSRPLHAKNGLQLPGNSHPAPAGAQRIAKRRYSMGVGFKGLAKRRRRANSDSQSESVLPSNFLLGGNIFDPLNLNSLLDEDVNRATNQETPKCSPLPLRGGDPVEILKRSSSAALTVPLLTREGGVSASPLPCELNTAITCRDDVAPPPILPRRHTHPLPGNLGDGRQQRRRRTTSIRSSDCAAMATTATRAQPTRFETPLVGGAKAGSVPTCSHKVYRLVLKVYRLVLKDYRLVLKVKRLVLKVYRLVLKAYRLVLKVKRLVLKVYRLVLKDYRLVLKVKRLVLKVYRLVLKDYRLVLKVYRLVLKVYRLVLKDYRLVLKDYRLVLKVYRLVLKEYRLVLKEYRLVLKVYRLVLKVYRLVLKDYRLVLKDYRLVLKVYRLVLKEYRLVLKEYRLVLKEYRLVLKVYRLVLKAYRLVLKAHRLVLKVYRLVLKDYRLVLKDYRLVLKVYRLVLKEYRLVLKEYRLVLKEYRLVLKEYRLVLKVYRLVLKAYRLVLKVYRLVLKEYRLVLKVYRLVLKEYRLVLKVYRLVLKVYRLVLKDYRLVLKEYRLVLKVYRLVLKVCGGAQSGSVHPPQKKKKDKHRYQHGNHSRYYGYQGFYGDGCEGHVGPQDDPRLRLLRSDWFRDRTVLDIGCGTGHMTLAVARRFNPAHILGVELNERLVHAANQNIRHFMSHDLVLEERRRRREEKMEDIEEVMEASLLSLPPSLPLSFRVSRGPLSAPPLLLPPSSSSRFPHNVTFIQGDYVSLQEVWPGRGQYDVIMCLNVTKWVQMHSGEDV